MGVYLPNMKMPEKGQMLVIFPDGTSYVCFNGMRERLAQTEAVPVLPHGRLIDAYAFVGNVRDKFHYDSSRGREYITAEDFHSALIGTPTVIEAEEGE